MSLDAVQRGLEAATSSMQAVQHAHKAEIAFLEAGKETDMVNIKAAAVRRVKHLVAELDSLKMGDVSRSCATLGAEGMRLLLLALLLLRVYTL